MVTTLAVLYKQFIYMIKCHKWLNKRQIKAAIMCAARVVLPSGHFMNHKSRDKTNWLALQSPTQMVAHGILTSSHEITEANSCVGCWPKPLIRFRLCPPNNNGYLVERKLANCEWH